MASPIHQWIDAVTTRVEDQRRIIEKLDRDLSDSYEVQSDLRESVARLQMQHESIEKLHEAEIKRLEGQITECRSIIVDERQENRKARAKMMTITTGAITTLGGLAHLYLGN